MLEGQRIFDAVVEEVHSGDDLLVLVDLGVDGLYKRVRARLQGVDTPSAFRATKDTEAGKIRDYVRGIVSRGKCRVALHSEGKGGWLVTLLVNNDVSTFNVNDDLMVKGYVYGRLRKSSDEG